MQKLHFYKILLIVLLLSGALFAQGHRHGRDMPGGRKGMSAVALDGKIWLLGGSQNMHGELNSVAIYDPLTDAWQQEGPAFQYARDNATAQVYDGRIYIFGGRHDSEIVSAVEMFDANAGYWQTVSEMPAPRFGLTSVVVDSAIWLIGGSEQNSSSSQRVDIYYPASNRWEQGPSLATGRSSAMAALIQGTVYVFGGFYFGPVSGYEKYDPGAGAWQMAGSMPSPMAASGYAGDGSTMWLAGGMGSGGMTDQVLRFDGQSWTPTATLTRAKSECAAVVFDGRLYVFGGQAGHMMGGTVDNSVEIFELTTAVEKRDDSMPQQFALLAAYPNPFAVSTTIELKLPQQEMVDIQIYDLLGRSVGRLFQGQLSQGRHVFPWRANDMTGTRLPAGTYFVRLQGERFQVTQKIFIVD